MAETAASLAVLLILCAVAGWLWIVQSRFSPAVMVTTTAAKAAGSAEAPPPSPAPAPIDFMTPLPATLHAMSPTEVFSPATLSDKIDGKAELYLSAGFVGMRCQRLAPIATPSAWFEAFVYDLGQPERAFAVYSSQKRTATEEVGLGDYSYRAGNQLCLVHGRYYLEIVGADDSPATKDAATELARQFVTTTVVDAHANVAKDEALFPAEGLIAGSVMLLSSDVFGFDQLNQTYVARYQDGGDTVTLYLSRRPSSAEAAKLATAVHGFFVNDCGGTDTPSPSEPAGAAIIDSGGAFDGVFAVGPFVAGVHQAPSRDSAARWLKQLHPSLHSVSR